ncbi:carbohydrate ABC transporter permease [Cellulosimicrobium cellulans]|uniref:carbohydrate ABC transporter permease n=1 Tax=Cellulosimicrobium cellulans TaxID=1710 RepID=UPI0036F16F93
MASAVVWGAGQVANRQPLKGAMFFAFFVATLLLELMTGRYPAGPDGFRFRENGGFFLRGIWGLVTLGTTPRQMGLSGLTAGDHSIVLMVNGIIALFVMLLLGCVWVWSVRDAAKVARLRDQGEKAESSVAYFRNLWQTSYAYLVLMPSIVLVLFVSALPIVFGVAIAFTSYDRNHLPPAQLVEWTGLANFGRVVAVSSWAQTFAGVFIWTVVWAVLATLSTYLFGFVQASILASKRVRFPRLWRSIYILPWAVPAMISALVFRSMFNGQFGPISGFLVDIGLTDERINWFTDPNNPNLARAVALLVNLWLGFPYFMALIGGTLTNIDKSYYEAARLDGASTFQQFRAITFPIVYRATAPLVILAFVSNFNNFGVIYFLTEGGPANPDYQYAGNTDLLITWLYKLTLDNRLYNIGAVMSIIIFMIVGAFSVWNLRRSRALEDGDL